MLLQWAHCSPHLRQGQYFNECFLLQSGHNWLGCHFQQTYLTWAIFLRTILLPTRSCLHFLSSFSLLVLPYDHSYYWSVLLLSHVFWGGSSFSLLFQVSTYFFAHWHEVISLTIEAQFSFPHFIQTLYQIYLWMSVLKTLSQIY